MHANGHWTKTTDRLPDDMTEVFFFRFGEVLRGWFRAAPEPHFDVQGMRYRVSTELVTHWMPSPTPEPPAE